MKNQSKWKKVVPTKASNPELFSGKDREWILQQNGYDTNRAMKVVIPNETSDFHNYMMEKRWNGISDFYDRRTATSQCIYDNLKIVGGRAKRVERRPFNLTVEVKKDAYPLSDKYEYVSAIRRFNLDKERKNDFGRGKGIKIEKPQGVKKDVKEPNSIYSPLFGPTFDDASSYGSRYSCSCGMTKTQQYEGTICPHCGQKVVRKDDDFSIFGWIVLEDEYVIHCGLYKSIEFFIGKSTLNNILEVKDDKDENGFSIQVEKTEQEPFADIGMIGFREHFDEIMNFYLQQNPNKIEYYEDIMKDRDKVFTHSIPVFTALLRPYHLNGDKFAFQDTNKNFNIMAMLGALLNNKETIKGRRAKKTRNQLLYDLQFNYNEVYDEVIKIMSSKKGVIRMLHGGRYNFTCRAVIVPNWKLRTDQIRLPFKALVKLLEHSIINILHSTYGMSLHEAKNVWDKAYTSFDERVWKIVKYIIKASDQGIPFIINRNPKHIGAYRGDSIRKLG